MALSVTITNVGETPSGALLSLDFDYGTVANGGAGAGDPGDYVTPSSSQGIVALLGQGFANAAAAVAAGHAVDLLDATTGGLAITNSPLYAAVTADATAGGPTGAFNMAIHPDVYTQNGGATEVVPVPRVRLRASAGWAAGAAPVIFQGKIPAGGQYTAIFEIYLLHSIVWGV